MIGNHLAPRAATLTVHSHTAARAQLPKLCVSGDWLDEGWQPVRDTEVLEERDLVLADVRGAVKVLD